jgi:hypothetical protein
MLAHKRGDSIVKQHERDLVQPGWGGRHQQLAVEQLVALPVVGEGEHHLAGPALGLRHTHTLILLGEPAQLGMRQDRRGEGQCGYHPYAQRRACSQLYVEEPASREARERIREQHRLAAPMRAPGQSGRPTKRDRREWEKLRGRE